MKEYELTILVHPDLEVDLETPLSKVRELITSSGGEIIKEDNWGKKRLAYSIKGEDFAVYNYFELNLPASAPLKISNNLNISEDVLRYLLVSADLKGRKALAEAKVSEDSVESTDEKE